MVWGTSARIELRTVDVMVSRLRKAITRGYLPNPVLSVRGSGYMPSETCEQEYRDWLAGGRRKLRLDPSKIKWASKSE